MTSHLSPEVLTKDRAKALIYALTALNENTLPSLALDKEKMTKTQITIDKVIQGIYIKSHLEDPFFLTEEIIKSAHDIRNDLMKRYITLFDLKAAFEAEPYYAKYVHIRPTILIQLAQALDYNYSIIKDHLTTQQKKIVFFKKSDNNHIDLMQKHLSIFQEKRKEIASVLFFQEKLFNTFGSEDFIAVLHSLVKNNKPKFLPTQSFFQFDENQSVMIVNYPQENLDAPSPIVENERRPWRLAYINSFADKEVRANFHEISMSPIKISCHQWIKWESKLTHLQKQTDLQRNFSIIPVELIWQVESGKILSHRMPLFLIPYFLEDDKNKPNLIYDFFIHQSAIRNNLFQINQYDESLTFLLRQVKSGLRLPDLFLFKKGNYFLSPNKKATRNHFLQLIEACKCFNQLYPMELYLLEQAKKECDEPLFEC